jgi:TolB-like protein/tetratricopeptide (TPR) repeat protein
LIYRFGNYSLDVARQELRHGTELKSVEPKVLDLLLFLIRNRERVVSKDDLITNVWQGRIVSESTLTSRITALRQAIGDTGQDQRLVRTIARKGLRFIGEVREPHDGVGEHVPAAPEEPAPSTGKPAPVLPDKPSIVVLPFTNISGDPDQEFFGDGLAEDVSTELSKFKWLFVISRKSGLAFKGKAVDAKQVSRELGVRYVLEGSVRRAGGRVRVTGQLIDASTGMHVWAERYDRDPANIFAVQDEITGAVAAAIGPAIVNAERQRAVRKPPENLGAWEAYQRGLWHVCKHDAAENDAARRLFERAVELDPGFAAAYDGMALTYCMSAATFYTMDYAEACSLAEQFARKAIALDENDADARAWLGWALFVSGDREGASQEAGYALSMNANCAEAFALKGAALIYSGRREEGREAMRQFLTISPRDPTRPNRLAQIAASHYLDCNYESALEAARQTIRQYPRNAQAYRWLAASLGQLGRAEEAKAALDALLSLAPPFLERFAGKQLAMLRADDYEHALQGLRKAGWPG